MVRITKETKITETERRSKGSTRVISNEKYDMEYTICSFLHPNSYRQMTAKAFRQKFFHHQHLHASLSDIKTSLPPEQASLIDGLNPPRHPPLHPPPGLEPACAEWLLLPMHHVPM
jgi:hypothetical protein